MVYRCSRFSKGCGTVFQASISVLKGFFGFRGLGFRV